MIPSLRRTISPWVAAAALALPGCGSDGETPPDDGTLAPIESGAELLGGATTTFGTGANAYTLPARNFSSDHRDAFSLGDHFFNRNWVTAPASITGNDGLGPTFNATSCSACHFKDGRGSPPLAPGDRFVGLLLRLSVPGQDAHGGPLGEPNYGGQFNPNAVLGVPAEGEAHVSYEEVPGQFADGEAYSLRRPSYTFEQLAFGPMAPDVMVSPRVAPVMIGLGLLEAIAEPTLATLADETDRDGDGISGRPNTVWDVTKQAHTVGRFGWKANQPSVLQQTAGAFLGDIGITSRLFPQEDCPSAQVQCRATPSGGTPSEPELSDDKLSDLEVYGRGLSVPARRNVSDLEVRRGQKLFSTLGCAACHTPKLTTGTLEGFPELSNQVIRPFTDLLLHDLGPDLADGRPDGLASGTEWRTAPLWGMGLQAIVSRHTTLLHDGRARDAQEAILWHGGEAERSREAFRSLTKTDRTALLRFLGSL